MKNIKNKKIVIFAVLLCLVFSMTTVSCFAAEDIDESYVGFYHFRYELSFDGSYEYPFELQVLFSCDAVDYGGIELGYGPYGLTVYYINRTDQSSVLVYDNGQWLSDKYRTIYIYEIYHASAYLDYALEFLNLNQYVEYDGFYFQLEKIITQSLFSDEPLSSEQQFSVTLLSTILAFLTLLVPFIITGAAFVWIMKRL